MMTTRSILVSQRQIRDYGRLNGDALPIHYDAAAAQARGFRGPIAHGTMLVALIADAALELHGARFLNGGTLRVRFVAPVCADDLVTLAIGSDGAMVLRVEPLQADPQVAVTASVEVGTHE
jgi:3-hydroxybutyryl-CoA dehydratase